MHADSDEQRIQRCLTTAMHAVHADRLHQELVTRAGDAATQDLVAACSADFSARIFTAQLSDPYNRLKPPEFVCFARRFLQLPPLARLGNGAPREGYTTGHVLPLCACFAALNPYARSAWGLIQMCAPMRID